MKNLIENIIQISKSCSKDVVRCLDRVAVDRSGDKLRLRATNGYQLAEILMPIPEGLEDISLFCVSLDDIKGLKLFLSQSKKDKIFLLQYNKGLSIIFKNFTTEFKILFSKYAPDFPDTERIKPRARTEFTISLNPKLLLDLAQSLGFDEKSEKITTLKMEVIEDKKEKTKEIPLTPIRVLIGQNEGFLMPMRGKK